jgi:hypothetical protein
VATTRREAFENRRRIWDAIVDLFVELHLNGVYWGDASLANTLIKFYKIEIPHLGKKTQLKAILADAETVEIHDSISDSLRQADVGFFLEAMEWLDEDLRASGVSRDELATEQDKAYIQTQYDRLYETALRGRDFEKLSGLNIPVCDLLKQESVLDFFPGKTAAEFYVEIMNHKYILSQQKGRDVGLIHATRDFAKKYGQEPPLAAFWNSVARKVRQLVKSL